MAATIVIETSLGEPWIETSPNDPSWGTVPMTGSTVMVSQDTGPWTILFPAQNAQGIVPSSFNNTKVTSATVQLVQTGPCFTVNLFVS